jgi:hypothetical protein
LTRAPFSRWRLSRPASLLTLFLLTAAGPIAKPACAAGPPPRTYVAHLAARPPVIDGRLDDPSWRDAAWTGDFLDIEGEASPRPRFRTRVKMAWDSDHLYVAAELEEPHVWATLTEHDSVIFHDNDFEVFLDPDGDNHHYSEFEINALNTGWDLRLPAPYRDDGKAQDDWEMPGLKTAVSIQGTLNDPMDIDVGWTVELALPWAAIVASNDAHDPPLDGDTWRMNFSRVEWKTRIEAGKYVKFPGKREDNWVWSPQYAVDMHRPERWGFVQFRSASAPPDAEFVPDPDQPIREQLMRVYHAQRSFRDKYGRYARTLDELDLAPDASEGTMLNASSNEETGKPAAYTATARGASGREYSMSQDSLLRPLKPAAAGPRDGR